MSPRDEIAIIDLLRLREAEFVKIWQCEESIRGILGLSSYPFVLPVDLPSRAKGKRTMSAHGGKRKTPAMSGVTGEFGETAPALRRLVSGENAYRLEYEHEGEMHVSFQTDEELLKKLFSICGERFRIKSIATVVFRSMEDWETREVLFGEAP